jgi:hypothetical protein
MRCIKNATDLKLKIDQLNSAMGLYERQEKQATPKKL